MNALNFAAAAVPSFPLADALMWGVPPDVAEDGRLAGRLDLTRPDGSRVRFLWDGWPPGPRGTWVAKVSHKGRTLTGYAGGHRPRGGGVAGLSRAGVRRAVDGIERQRARWDSGEAQPKRRYPCCSACGRPLPLAR